MGDIQWDPKIKKEWRIGRVQRRGAKWSAVSVNLLEPDNPSSYFIRIAVQDASGAPMPGVLCCCDWEQRPKGPPPCAVTEPYDGPKKGTREFDFGASIIDPENGTYGVKYCYVEDRSKSDEVTGLGLVVKEPHNFLVTFKLNSKPPVKKTLSARSNKAKPKRPTKK